jgi:hypothetical protein
MNVTPQCSLLEDLREPLASQAMEKSFTPQCSSLKDVGEGDQGIEKSFTLQCSTLEDIGELLGNQAVEKSNNPQCSSLEDVGELSMLSKMYESVTEYFLLHTSEHLQHKLFLVNRKLESYLAFILPLFFNKLINVVISQPGADVWCWLC